DSSILFSATISEEGNILDFQLDNKWLPYAYYHESYIQLLPNNETSFYLKSQGNIELRDFNLKTIKKVDYTGEATNQLRVGTLSEFKILKDSSFLMLTEDGNLSFQDSFILKPFITLAKWDKNLQLNIQDTVNIPIETIGELLTDVVTAASKHIILDTD